MLMHMFLFKGVTYFEKEMQLTREHEGEPLPIQLWSADMSWDASEANFVRFDRYFASKLRILLSNDNPRIPKLLLDFIRRMDSPNNLEVYHN